VNERFLQLHFLTSYPAALLNRDDAGFAKRIPFGGVTRTRVSSQCLKRHWRTSDSEHALSNIQVDGGSVPMSIRSRRTFERFVLAPLVKEGVGKAIAEAVTNAVMDKALGAKDKAQDKDKKEAGKKEKRPGRSEQVTVFGRSEMEFFLSQALSICGKIDEPKKAKEAVKEHFKKDAKKNLESLMSAAGLDAALFGRMVTGDILARGDAAIHVAHAFTVHAEAAETDYFSAVDDLLADAEEAALGSGHINTSELTSGLYYGYVVVDIPLLVSNIEGCEDKDWIKADRSLAGEVVERLLHLVARVSPGAKLGSTAPYAYAHFVLAEAGNSQPRSLANAFLAPVRERPDLLHNSYASLAGHIADLDGMYGRTTERRFAGMGPVEVIQEALPEMDRADLEGVASWCGSLVSGS